MDLLSEKLTIETPEQISLEFNLAGIGSRFYALFYDTLLQFLGGLVLFLVMSFVMADLAEFWPKAWTWTAAILILLWFLIYWGYFAFFEAIWNGQTPGKRKAGIRVIKNNGRSINAFEAIARNFLRAIDQMPGMYAVGVISIFFDQKNRRLGDFVAGTVVVHERPQEEIQPSWPQNATATSFFGAGSFNGQDLEVIETFLHRRLDLPAEVRARTAQMLADKMAGKLASPPEQRTSNEDFLEKLAVELRSTARYR